LDGCVLDVGNGTFQFVGVLCADGDQAGGSENAVGGGEVGFLLEDIVVLSALLGVLDLADPLTLGGVGDVLGLLLADVAGGLVGAHRGVEQGEVRRTPEESRTRDRGHSLIQGRLPGPAS
jgi:hypothetical protein